MQRGGHSGAADFRAAGRHAAAIDFRASVCAASHYRSEWRNDGRERFCWLAETSTNGQNLPVVTKWVRS